MAQRQSELPNPLKIGNAEYEARVRAGNIALRWLLDADPLRRAFRRRFAVTIDVGNGEVKSRVG